MTTGHIAGVPVEELLLPLVASGGTVVLVSARAALSRWRRKPRPDGGSGSGSDGAEP